MMRVIRSGDKYMAVQGVTGPRGRANAAGWGESPLEAMAACGDLVAVLDATALKAGTK